MRWQAAIGALSSISRYTACQCGGSGQIKIQQDRVCARPGRWFRYYLTPPNVRKRIPSVSCQSSPSSVRFLMHCITTPTVIRANEPHTWPSMCVVLSLDRLIRLNRMEPTSSEVKKRTTSSPNRTDLPVSRENAFVYVHQSDKLTAAMHVPWMLRSEFLYIYHRSTYIVRISPGK